MKRHVTRCVEWSLLHEMFAMDRIRELRSLAQDASIDSVFLSDIDERLKDKCVRNVLQRRENDLQALDDSAWNALKEKVSENQSLYRHKPGKDKPSRGWEPLVAILNEAKAYRYLRDIGCTSQEFVKQSKEEKKSPDLKGQIEDKIVVCEVKTIFASDDEVERRHNLPAASETRPCLHENFLECKLNKTIKYAISQIIRYEKPIEGNFHRKIIFLILNFDDYLGEYRENYYAQIDDYIENRYRSFEIVFFNQWNGFSRDVRMRNAVVINEAE